MSLGTASVVGMRAEPLQIHSCLPMDMDHEKFVKSATSFSQKYIKTVNHPESKDKFFGKPSILVLFSSVAFIVAIRNTNNCLFNITV